MSYKPEIPYQQSGNGEITVEFVEDPDFYYSNYGVFAVYAGSGCYWQDFFDPEAEALFRSRYQRRDEPDQTIPKIPWKNVRKWKNSKTKRHGLSVEQRRALENRRCYLQENRDHYSRRKLPKSRTDIN